MNIQLNQLIKSLVFLFLLLVNNTVFSKSGITPVNLKTEYKTNPFIDDVKPRLSWELESEERNQYQSAYQILVASSPEILNNNQGDVWNSGIVKSSRNNHIVYKGKVLVSGQKVWWKVKSWNAIGKEGNWSDVNTWEMGKLDASEWEAKWIGYNTNHLSESSDYHLPPSPYLRKEKLINKPIKKARLYISSLGLHEFYINGGKIGKDYFASGWTDYDKRIYYNVYDVTDDLQIGNNVFGSILSNGWYAGYLGYALLVGSKTVKQFYGQYPLLKAQIDVEYIDGSRDTIVTDKSWKRNTGAVVESDILQGEMHDARKEPVGWMVSNYNIEDWGPVEVRSDENLSAVLQLYPGEPVRVVQELEVDKITEVEDGKYIFDLGQNFAGVVQLNVQGIEGDTIVLRYGEMLYPDGRLVTENLRKARATDTYILKGDPEGEIWSPKFTYHGFQYVEVSGLRVKPDKAVLKGLVMTSDLTRVGSFQTDNDMVNQLYSNIIWTQWANYFDIPTDCPQRDERQGWTCDAQIYIGSAKFNNDISTFYKKWIRDLNDGQWENGAYPIYAPMPQKDQIALIRESDSYSPGWSDAGIICPYEIYASYGDIRIIEESMPYMVRYMDFLREKSENSYVLKEDTFKDIKGGFGDWLSIGNQTSPDLLASMYYFHNAKLMVEMCEAIGDFKNAEKYEKESILIQKAFKKHYMEENGKFRINSEKYKDYPLEEGKHFSGHTQTAYANALYFGILEEEDALIAGKQLRQLIIENNDQLSTGFLGFKPLFPALSASGSQDKAFHLFLSTEYPSLGYEVANGATSIWERWDSYTKDKGFVHNAAMNSFSHYAFGAVNEWMFENIAGIRRRDVGYKSIEIRPEIPEEGITEVRCSYYSIQGEIESNWTKKREELIQNIKIPVNTTAYCYFPTNKVEDIIIDGVEVRKNEDVISFKIQNGQTVIKLGSGDYHITTSTQ